MLGRKHGFVFYEGDCIMQSLNPFIDLNVEEPTMVQNQQTPLKVKFTNYVPIFRKQCSRITSF